MEENNTTKREEYPVSFYNENDEEIGRKVYKGTYGGMIFQAMRRAKKIGATHFWHKHYLRKFEVKDV